MPLRSLRWRGWRTRHEVQLQLAVSPLIAGAAPSPTVTALPRLCSCPHLHALGPAACQGACLRLGVYRLARLNQWAKAGVFDQVHLEVLDRLGLAGRLDWSSASVDWASVRAKRGGTTLAQIPSIVTSQGQAPPGQRRRPTAPAYAVAGSHCGSPGVGSSPRPGWDATGGGSSGRCRGCRVTGVWRFAGIGTQSGGLGSCCWPVRLFASRLYRQQDRNERLITASRPGTLQGPTTVLPASGPYQAGLVGQHYGLDSVAKLQLGQ
jgi:hypothetical protein